MNKSILIGAIVAALGIGGGVAIGSYTASNSGPEYADIVAVDAVTETVSTPREVCHNETVTHQAPSKDTHNVVGTAVGAIVGGVVGNQFGGGNGKKVLTAAGAVGGGYAGNQIQSQMKKGDTYTTTEQRCETVQDASDKVVGYDVKVDMGDETRTVRLEDKPDVKRFEIRDGELVLPQQG
ncbi:MULTISPECIES: glycine zipper 2TM domain-containing protein [Cobetia]|uniref:glycine zipper 2TM domain-containing protein n=1 Tax=Cobetia TaxID=204286 RepID=UPI001583CA3F|nr:MULTISPECIES: glycine zipper 2TM domain-containing protein [Cobetia]MDI4660573.1 glycine zipper 2TM domain-containing protein [Cobetia sp. BMC6]MDL2190066.1 glycine zipper 2TM domain-containing protein [Cobetia sp. LC6]NUJ54793.1 glycine zipper 2TM domain-containing protein [Cobetia marina]